MGESSSTQRAPRSRYSMLTDSSTTPVDARRQARHQRSRAESSVGTPIGASPCLGAHPPAHPRDRRRQVDNRIVAGKTAGNAERSNSDTDTGVASLRGERGHLLLRTGKRGYRVTFPDQRRDRMTADRPGATGDKHPHTRTLTIPSDSASLPLRSLARAWIRRWAAGARSP